MKPTDPTFLTVEEIVTFHADRLRLFGGSPGLRDRGLLESAVAMPMATLGGSFLHETLFEMAAAYAFHIAENQPFVDGNKRTGLNRSTWVIVGCVIRAANRDGREGPAPAATSGETVQCADKPIRFRTLRTLRLCGQVSDSDPRIFFLDRDQTIAYAT